MIELKTCPICLGDKLVVVPYNELRMPAYIAVFEYVGKKQNMDKGFRRALFWDLLGLALQKVTAGGNRLLKL